MKDKHLFLVIIILLIFLNITSRLKYHLVKKATIELIESLNEEKNIKLEIYNSLKKLENECKN